MLQNGIYIQNFTTQNLKIKQLYIKWDEKLTLKAQEIALVHNKKSSSEFSSKSLHKTLRQISLFDTWFEKVSLQNIRYNSMQASFEYEEGQEGVLILEAPTFELLTKLWHEKEYLVIDIGSLHEKKLDLIFEGRVVLNTNSFQGHSLLDLSYKDQKIANIALESNIQKLTYTLNLHENFYKLKELLSKIQLPKEIHFWARDAIELESFELEKLYGTLIYDNIKNFYKKLYIKAKAHKLHYTYNTTLDAIHTKYTDLEFSEGVLYIRPQDAYSYGMFLDKSWLKIDFTKKEELLTLYLLFESSLNKEILHILKTYKINIPFYQHSGNIVTNLRLAVNLMTIDVDAKGNFYTKEGNFDYKDLNVDVANLRLFLDNYEIKINNMRAFYQDIASANVDVVYDAKSAQGNIDLSFDAINLQEYGLFLDTTHKNLNVNYIMGGNAPKLLIPQSKWNYLNKLLEFDGLEFLFHIDTLAFKLPETSLKLHNVLQAKLQGSVDLLKKQANLAIDLEDFSYEGIKLKNQPYPLELVYKEGFITLDSPQNLSFGLEQKTLLFEKPKIIFQDALLQGSSKKISFDSIAATNAQFSFNLEKKEGKLKLQTFDIFKETGKKLFEKEELSFRFYENNISEFEIQENSLAFYAQQKQNKWHFSFNDLCTITESLSVLKPLNITRGKASFFLDENLDGTITLSSPYKFLVQNGIEQEEYTLKTSLNLDVNALDVEVNDHVQIHIAQDIKIAAQDIGFNMQAIIELINKTQENSSIKEDDSKQISLEAQNSSIYLGSKRKVISDLFRVTYFKGKLEGVLWHAGAQADLRYYNTNLYFYGEKFNDRFMENLFAISKLEGGSFTFSLHGSNKLYDGVFSLENTRIIDYTLVNNIFAFVNTIPALTTFSLPKYSQKGLLVKDGVVHVGINTQEGNVSIQEVFLGSDELTIVGKGDANYIHNKIDLLLNLQTNIANQVSKIPLVGYILFDGESISTTLSIEGKLDDPNVRSHLAQDIIVAPLNILKRTLLFPYDLLKKDEKR